MNPIIKIKSKLTADCLHHFGNRREKYLQLFHQNAGEKFMEEVNNAALCFVCTLFAIYFCGENVKRE